MDTVQQVEEQLHRAVVGLASGPGRIQQRLADAFEGALAALSPDDFPTELAGEFAGIRDEILAHIPTALAVEPDETADEALQVVARKIVSFSARYASYAALVQPA